MVRGLPPGSGQHLARLDSVSGRNSALKSTPGGGGSAQVLTGVRRHSGLQVRSRAVLWEAGWQDQHEVHTGVSPSTGEALRLTTASLLLGSAGIERATDGKERSAGVTGAGSVRLNVRPACRAWGHPMRPNAGTGAPRPPGRAGGASPRPRPAAGDTGAQPPLPAGWSGQPCPARRAGPARAPPRTPGRGCAAPRWGGRAGWADRGE